MNRRKTMNMLDQVKEFNAWGLSKLAIRNIIVFFFLIETVALVTLGKTIIHQQNLRERDRVLFMEKDNEKAELVERLKNEQIAVIRELNNAIQRQQSLETQIDRLGQRINKIKR